MPMQVDERKRVIDHGRAAHITVNDNCAVCLQPKITSAGPLLAPKRKRANPRKICYFRTEGSTDMKRVNFVVVVLAIVTLLFASANQSAAGPSEYSRPEGLLRMKHS